MTSDMVEYERRSITVDEFHRMAEIGIFDEDERVELIDGELIVPPQMGPRHAGSIERLVRLLIARVGNRASVRSQVPLPLVPRSEPFPDYVIARYDAGFYSDRHPSISEVFWVIEIGDASRAFDRNKKFPLYARHRIRETWLLDLVDRRLIVGRGPTDLGYAQILTLAPGASISPEAFGDVAFSVDELLGATT